MLDARQVLVIDKDAEHRASVLEIIESMDVEPIPVDSVEAMVSRYASGSSGCVIADTNTVGVGGLEFLGNLSRLTCDLPAILIAGNATVPMAVRAMQAGAVTVLERPCGRQELRDAVRLALKQGATLRAHAARLRKFRLRLAQLLADEMEARIKEAAGELLPTASW